MNELPALKQNENHILHIKIELKSEFKYYKLHLLYLSVWRHYDILFFMMNHCSRANMIHSFIYLIDNSLWPKYGSRPFMKQIYNRGSTP